MSLAEGIGYGFIVFLALIGAATCLFHIYHGHERLKQLRDPAGELLKRMER